jgi:hypothetical protein
MGFIICSLRKKRMKYDWKKSYHCKIFRIAFFSR